MRNPRHTLLTLAIALATAAVALLLSIETGPAIILGAVGGIVASIVMQRRTSVRSASITGSDDIADIDASIQAAASSVLQIQNQTPQIYDPDVQDIAKLLGKSLGSVLTLATPADRAGVAPLVLDQLIEPAQALLTDYLWLQKRGETASRDAMTKIATRDLPAAEHSARQVMAILERPGPVDVSAIRRAVDFQFSFGGETISPSAEMWGNRQRLVEGAERLNSG